MPQYLLPENVDDFVTLTETKKIRHRWTDLALQYQKYVFARLIQEHKVQEQATHLIDFQIQTKDIGTARNTGLYAQDVTKVDDVMITGQVNWSFQTVNYSWDIDEPIFQSDRETIIRMLVVREHTAHNAMASLQEQNLWSAPTSTTDNRPYGIPFWLQKDATTTPGGDFNGGNPAGFTNGAAGVNSSTYPRYKNWTFGYDVAEVDDLIAKTKKAIAFTEFMPPHNYPKAKWGDTDYMIYTTYRVQEPLERAAELRNDNLGPDLARYVNSVTIAGVPLMWVPYLETNDTTDPVYGVNWSVMRPYCHKGRNMRRSKIQVGARQHNLRTIHIDHAWNTIVTDRRGTFAGSKS